MATEHKAKDANEYEVLFDAVVRGGIDDLARAAYRLIGEPIAVADDIGRFIAQCPVGASEPRSFKALQKAGGVSVDEFFAGVKDLSGVKIHPGVPVLVSGVLQYEGYQLITRFEEKTAVVGYASVAFGDRRPTDRERHLTSLFFRALAPELSRRHATRFSREQELLSILNVGGEAASEREAALLSMNKRFTAPFRILYVKQSEATRAGVIARLRHDFNANQNNAVAVAYGDSLAVLLWGGGSSRESLQGLARLFDKYQLRGAVSESFDALDAVPSYYQQAKATWDAARAVASDEHLLRYGDFAPLQPFAICANAVDISVFVHPAVKVLKSYDAEHGSGLLSTLDTYVRCNAGKAKAARALNIHPNTLLYRLQRIEELCHVDLADARTIEELRVSLYLAKFLE